jgi:Putative zinc-finger
VSREHSGNDLNAELLRQALRPDGATTGADCIDAETAAAWADGRLSRNERGALEAHAAGCGRCQGLLAALVRTAPESKPPMWSLRPIRWAIPLAIAGAATAVFVTTVPPRTGRAPAPPPPAPAAPHVAAEAKPEPQPSLQADARNGPARSLSPDRANDALSRQRAKKATDIDTFNEMRQDEKQKAQAQKAQAAASEPSALADTVTVPLGGTTAPAAAAPPPQPPAERRDAAARSVIGAPQSLLKSATAVNAVAIQSPDPAISWRFVQRETSTDVEHTADGGASWQRQQTPGGLVTAGGSPGASICWLVGRSGLVMLTRDGGATWSRTTPPDVVDLVGIAPIDGLSATVTAADGRLFRTADGGQTWVPAR